ncbi:cupin (plasmid) [Paraburkholderia hospita]|nr:cupin [Paraburkholderia hospita]
MRTEPRPSRHHIEMAGVSDEGWVALEGFAGGLEVHLLADDLDESRKRGGRSRLVRFAPGASTSHTLVHDYWEEVFVLSGDLLALEDVVDGDTDTSKPGRNEYRYSCRPPGTPHGPFQSPRGCVLFEVQYFLPDYS